MLLSIDIKHKLPEFLLDVSKDIEVPFLGIFGPSGAGKSTLLHIIAGLVPPVSGNMSFKGRTLFDSESKTFVPAYKRNIGLVFQDYRLFPHMNVEENLSYGRKKNNNNRHIDYDDVIDILRLSPLLKRRVSVLSGGERQRVAIGRALLSSPELLLLDEPCSALDAALRNDILGFLQRLHRKMEIPMIMVSHQVTDILRFTDQILFLEKGKVTGFGNYHELLMGDDNSCNFPDKSVNNIITAKVGSSCSSSGVTSYYSFESDGYRRIIYGSMVRGLEKDDCVSLEVGAEDISLAMAPVEYISVQNQLPVNIKRMKFAGNSCLCEVEGAFTFIVKISLKAVKEFDLKEGMNVWAMFKANSLNYIGRALPSNIGEDINAKQQSENPQGRVRRCSNLDDVYNVSCRV